MTGPFLVKQIPFLHLVLSESSVPLRRLALMTVVSGLAHMLVLAIVNRVAEEISQGSSVGTGEGSSTALDFLGFLIVILLFVYSQRYTALTAFRTVEDAVQRIRVRIGRKISACELAAFERIGRASIYGCLSRDTEVLSESSFRVIYGAQLGILAVFVDIYLIFVSWLAFALVSALILGAAFLLMSQRKRLTENLQAAAASGDVLLESMTHLLDGFKEVKLNNRRRDHLLGEMDSVSTDARASKIAARKTFAGYLNSTQVSFYVLLGLILFVVPRLSSSFATDAVQVSTAVLFIMIPIIGLSTSISEIEAVNRASENILRMERILDDNASPSTEAAAGAAPGVPLAIESLGVRELEFDYLDADGAPLFALGPLGLSVAAGETVFFVGGNGSGKSTLLKLLTSLYEPRSGSLVANGSPVGAENRQSFREQICAVFSDYHLFDRLYGLEDVSDAKANEMIGYLGLGGKTKVADGKFETLELSGGQRKRLGFLVALLEDRPIMVLDEVAADQDPDFRRRFYHEILPELQRAGKTLLVASHDDRYFATADRLVVLDEGRIREIVEPPDES